MIINRFTFIFVLFICRAPRRRIFAKGDVFAALSQLQDLVSLEQTLGQSLDVYLEAERARLDRIKRFARTVKAATERVKLEGLESLNNPGNSYGVVKRFVSGWRKLDSLLGQDYALGKTRCFDRVLQCGAWNFCWWHFFGARPSDWSFLSQKHWVALASLIISTTIIFFRFIGPYQRRFANDSTENHYQRQRSSTVFILYPMTFRQNSSRSLRISNISLFQGRKSVQLGTKQFVFLSLWYVFFFSSTAVYKPRFDRSHCVKLI